MPTQTKTLRTLQETLDFMNQNRGTKVTYVDAGKARSLYIAEDGVLTGVSAEGDDEPVNKTWKNFLRAATAGPVGPFTAQVQL